MSWVDIFYLTLVLCGLSGFAMALAYFSQQDLKFRAERQRAEQAAKPAPKPVKKAPMEERVLSTPEITRRPGVLFCRKPDTAIDRQG